MITGLVALLCCCSGTQKPAGRAEKASAVAELQSSCFDDFFKCFQLAIAISPFSWGTHIEPLLSQRYKPLFPCRMTQHGRPNAVSEGPLLKCSLTWVIGTGSPGMLSLLWKGKGPSSAPRLLFGIAGCKWPPSRCAVPDTSGGLLELASDRSQHHRSVENELLKTCHSLCGSL